MADFYGKPLLDYNMFNMKAVCDKIYVVCNPKNEHFFIDYPHITIKSGLGCGDAVLKALKILNPKKKDTIFIQWGDSIQEMWIYIAIKNKLKKDIIVPCFKCEKPYVQVIPELNGIKVRFSKYNEEISSGYNDCGVFYGNAKEIKKKLKEFAKKTKKNGKYVHKHGNELIFLDMFNETNIKTDVLFMDNYKGFNFNTIDEFNERKEIF